MPQDDKKDIDHRAFRNALGCFATGVTVITASDPGGPKVGLTANSFTSVSLNPPLVSWSLSRHTPSQTVFRSATHFAVHVLRADQQALAERFATRSDDKFIGLDLQEGLGAAPLLTDTLARFECRTAHRYYGGDHILFLGTVERFESHPGAPLMYFRGRFGHPEYNDA